MWTFDPSLLFIMASLQHEDELRQLFQAIESHVCLIRARQGVTYPDAVYHARKKLIRRLSIHEVDGGHHVHMDAADRVALHVNQFLFGS